MWGRTVHFIAMLCVTVIVIACDATKSSNPLSPSVAGPMPGVVITAPKPLEPANGWQLDNNTQPIRLMLENSSSTGPRPLTYIFEVASDAGFSNMVFSRGGVGPGDEGRTSIQMTDRLPTGVPFYWRALAEDGANSSGYSAAVSFSVITPVLIDAPVLLSPIGNAQIETNQPTFRIRNPARSGPAGALVYQLQVGPHEAFASPIATYQIGEQPGETEFAAPLALPFSQLFFWRARSFDTGSSGVIGPWSAAQPFRTGTAPAAPPPGPSGPAPGGPCISSNPQAIVACERAKYGHMSSSQMLSMLISTAKSLNANGIGGGPFGILRKSGGTQCGGYSCDIICAGQGTGQRQWDVLSDIQGAQGPMWLGPHTWPDIRVDVCEIQ
jgi:hypothetical protein